RAEHQVSREGRLDGDVRRLVVANLADEDDVRRLPHHGAQDSREVEADLVTNLRLVDSGQVVLDRVLRGDDLDVGTIELLERRVEGRRLSGAGRPGDEEDAVRPLDDLLEALVVGLVETELLEVDEAILLVED